MKSILAVALFAVSMSGVAYAQSAQQDKMKSCNAEAKGKTGDARKAFMKDCLSAKPAAPKASAAQQAQRDKMKSCNKEASGKKGDERKAFMKQCLSK